ncbi:delta-6 fatty acid desaturase [Fimicolochytrium jonesii]|uniref:delta-6 fatty acid desaturase n=1 Tax=Fimicolochytrium jonesii TaxID=1396493 RepID=UPI0022FDE0AA|nr:delta-6 fatty acid desaturase [Fimicolochytrium jonesii]KAI8826737.1 delta-6 fatty acid desaturase [Fimicolochytrium jonesii]
MEEPRLIKRHDSKLHLADSGSDRSRSVSPPPKVITKRAVDERVANGETLVIYEGKVYNATPFLKFHPGGELVVKHMAGCDATDEINGLHPRWVIDERLPRYFVGELVTEPPTDEEKVVLKEKERIRVAYKKLEHKIKAAGLFETNMWYYVAHAIQYATCWTSSVLLIVYGSQWWHYALSALFMGSFWHQTAFTAHDAGHNGITHDRETDARIGVFLGDFCGGLSIGWWKKSHYVHHIATNHPEHDPDIQQLPFFALSKRFLNDVYSSYYNRTIVFDDVAKLLIPFQHLYYYIVLLFGRFLLYFLSWQFLFTEPNYKKRSTEMILMASYFTWLGTVVYQIPGIRYKLMWILISHMSTVFLHIQINMSHFSMSFEDLGKDETFPAKMLRTTMDVECPWYLDWFHGGLQYQAIHHLFPRVPRHNLRKCIPYVKEFSAETGIKYVTHHFAQASENARLSLKNVADHVALMGRVAHAEAISGHIHM